MKTLTRRKSTRHLIFGLLSLLPLILLIFSVFRSGTIDMATINTQMGSILDWPMVDDFYTWLTATFFDGITNVYLSFAIAYFVWLMVITCLDIMFDFFFAILDLFHSWLDKFGGDY